MMDWKLFRRLLGFGLVVALLFCCVVIVPPWRMPTLWAEIDATQCTGLAWMLGVVVTGMVGIAYRESRHR